MSPHAQSHLGYKQEVYSCEFLRLVGVIQAFGAKAFVNGFTVCIIFIINNLTTVKSGELNQEKKATADKYKWTVSKTVITIDCQLILC